jgi:hypothetical protein
VRPRRHLRRSQRRLHAISAIRRCLPTPLLTLSRWSTITMPWTGPWRRTAPLWGPTSTPRPTQSRSRITRMNVSIGYVAISG